MTSSYSVLSCSVLSGQCCTQPGMPSTPTAFCKHIVSADFPQTEVAIELRRSRSTYTDAHVFDYSLNNCSFSTIISDIV